MGLAWKRSVTIELNLRLETNMDTFLNEKSRKVHQVETGEMIDRLITGNGEMIDRLITRNGEMIDRLIIETKEVGADREIDMIDVKDMIDSLFLFSLNDFKVLTGNWKVVYNIIG